MPSSADHCPVCAFRNVEIADTVDERAVEDILVEEHLTALLKEEEIIPAISHEGVSAERALAARRCAWLISQGKCPAFTYARSLNGGRIRIFRKGR